MKTMLTLIMFSVLFPAIAESTSTTFADQSWQIRLNRDDAIQMESACVSFYTGGQFVMSDRELTMLWKPHPHDSRIFVAITNKDDRTVVPFHRGVQGYITPDGILRGAGIDQNGHSFEFEGLPTKRCPLDIPKDVGNSEDVSDIDIGDLAGPVSRVLIPQPTPSQNRVVIDLGVLIKKMFATLVDPCAIWWCDPIEDPTGGSVGAKAFDNLPSPATAQLDTSILTSQSPAHRSLLSGRTFRFRLSNTDNVIREVCWAFEIDDTINAADGAIVRWARDDMLTDATRGFRAVGVRLAGHAMSYSGALISDRLIYVQGIESVRGFAIATYGFGEAVESCDLNAIDYF